MKPLSPTHAILLAASCSGAAFFLGHYIGKGSSPSAAIPGLAGHQAAPVKPATRKATQTGPALAGDELKELLEEATPGQPNTRLLQGLQAAFDLGNVFQRRARFQQLLSIMRDEDGDAINALFKQEDKKGRWYTDEYVAFWNQWGCVAGASAVAEMTRMDGKKGNGTLWGNVISGWASKDASAALAWITANEADHLHRTALWASLAAGLSESDPHRALELIAGELPNESRQNAITACANSAVQKGGIPFAREWLGQALNRTASDMPMAKSATSAIVTAVERAGHPALEELALTFRQNSTVQTTLPDTLSGIWRGDHFRILDFMARLPGEFNTRQSLSTAISQLTQADPDRTGEWLKQHPEAPHYDTAAAEYAKAILRIDPSAAAAWTSTIKDPALKQEVTAVIEGAR